VAHPPALRLADRQRLDVAVIVSYVVECTLWGGQTWRRSNGDLPGVFLFKLSRLSRPLGADFLNLLDQPCLVDGLDLRLVVVCGAREPHQPAPFCD
jgi:hypothetical protein